MNLDPMTRSAMLEAIPPLTAFANSLCRDQDRANDLVQEALLRACINIDKFRQGSNMAAWLVAILRNQYYSDFRKRRREVEDVDGIYAESVIVEPEQLDHLEREDICTALAELPHDLRRPLMLIGFEGVSYEEAAQVCSCALGTIKSRVHRARARLAARLSIDRPNDLTPLRSAA